MAIKDPNEAYLRLTMAMYKENVPVDEGEKILNMYMERYGVTDEEMAFTSDGERVLNHQLFW